MPLTMKELVLKDATNSGDQTLSKRLKPLVEYGQLEESKLDAR